MRPAAIPALALTMLTVACGRGSLPPFDTLPMPPPRGVHENFSRVGVCYSRETSTPRQILDVARRNCEPGTRPWLIEQDTHLTCPLLTPIRATFACLKPGMAPPAR
ncbi:MAG TPA: hypothetical protein VJN67_22000 [Stellaceae bacterium]|nr:hypothetical protein [Stellaceae bacterium]